MSTRIVTDIRMPAARATGNRDRSMPVVGSADPVGHWGDPRTAPFDARATPFRLLACLLYTSPSPRDKRQSRMPSSA